MEIRKRVSPWNNNKQRKGYANQAFYHTPQWKRTRRSFIASETLLLPSPDNVHLTPMKVSNRLCLECYKKGIRKEMHTVDHIIPIRLGGDKTDHTNLQSLCMHHHSQKSANEGNMRHGEGG